MANDNGALIYKGSISDIRMCINIHTPSVLYDVIKSSLFEVTLCFQLIPMASISTATSIATATAITLLISWKPFDFNIRFFGTMKKV